MNKKNEQNFLFHTDQSWTCLGCGECCGMWDIPVTKKEKERIESLDVPGFDFENETFFTPDPKSPGIFLIKKKNGKCAFLDDDDGLCAIHKKHGENVKALACRLYPFHLLHWKDGKISVSFRFDCKAVSRNSGRSITQQTRQMRNFSKELERGLKSNAKYNKKTKSSLRDLRMIADTYKEIMLDENSSLAAKLHYAASLLEFHSSRANSSFVVNVDNTFKSDTMTYLKENSPLFEITILAAPQPDKLQNAVFNYILTGYVRVDETEVGKSVLKRFPRAKLILSIIAGGGSLASINPKCPDTSGQYPLETLSASTIPPEWEHLMTRHAAAHLASLHMCGSPGLNLSFEEGMRHLLLMQPITLAIAAMILSGPQKQDSMTPELAVADAIRITDHTFYRSPFFSMKHVKTMIKWMTGPNVFPSILRGLMNPNKQTTPNKKKTPRN